MMQRYFFSSVIINFLLVLFFSGCQANPRSSEDYQRQVSEVKSLYDREQYGEAIDKMTHIIDTFGKKGPTSAEMFLLGSSYYRLGDLGHTILYYERAQRLDPSNEAIRHSLHVAGTKTLDRLESSDPFLVRIWNKICHVFPIGVTFFLSLLFFTILATGIFVYITNDRRLLRKVGFYSALGAFFFMLLSVTIIYSRQSHFFDTSEAIVTVGQSSIKSEPKSEGKTLFLLHEGTKVFVMKSEETADTWLKISSPNGIRGWIPTEDVTPIYPFVKETAD